MSTSNATESFTPALNPRLSPAAVNSMSFLCLSLNVQASDQKGRDYEKEKSQHPTDEALLDTCKKTHILKNSDVTERITQGQKSHSE